MADHSPHLQEQKRTFDVAELSQADAYKLASGLTVPRPIGWIGSVSASGVNNLAPYSFFNIVSADPPTFVVSPALGSRKDSLANIEETGVFSLNVVSEDTVDAMNQSAASFDADVDEFDRCGLTAVSSNAADAPLVREAVANFECTLTQMIPVGRPSGGAAGSNMLIIGEAHRIHVAERVCNERFHIDPHELKAVGRLAGGWYCRTADSLFTIDRPE